MAKQKSVLQFRGKLGQIVGMKNGFGGTEGFARSYVADPKNPQTVGQTAQRIRLLPAVNFRRQLQSVISRAWEGTKYGGASTRKFMKYALKEPLTNIPQVMKDESLAIPGKYLVSRGSLASITTEFSGNNLVFGLGVGDWSPTSADASKKTLAYLTQQLMQFNNGIIQNGDQLTIICCYSTDAANAPLTTVLYRTVSIVLDVSSTVAVTDIDSSISALDEGLSFNATSRLLGGCIVLSREGTANLRNTTRFEINEADTQLMEYFNASLKSNVRASYAKLTNSSTRDWPYEADSENSSDGPFQISVVSDNPTMGSVNGGGYYYRGDVVTCVATANDNYEFIEWQIDGEVVSRNASYQHTVDGAVRIVAKFEEVERP